MRKRNLKRKEVKFLTVSELQKSCFVNDTVMNEFTTAHPKQIVSDEIPVPVWKVVYKYTTKRENQKTAKKYILLEESSWDLVSSEFMKYIEEFNKQYPERKISNVEILDTEFLGKVFLQLD